MVAAPTTYADFQRLVEAGALVWNYDGDRGYPPVWWTIDERGANPLWGFNPDTLPAGAALPQAARAHGYSQAELYALPNNLGSGGEGREVPLQARNPRTGAFEAMYATTALGENGVFDAVQVFYFPSDGAMPAGASPAVAGGYYVGDNKGFDLVQTLVVAGLAAITGGAAAPALAAATGASVAVAGGAVAGATGAAINTGGDPEAVLKGAALGGIGGGIANYAMGAAAPVADFAEPVVADMVGLSTPADIAAVGASINAPVVVVTAISAPATLETVTLPPSAHAEVGAAHVSLSAPFSEDVTADMLGLSTPADVAAVNSSIVAPASLLPPGVTALVDKGVAAGTAAVVGAVKKLLTPKPDQSAEQSTPINTQAGAVDMPQLVLLGAAGLAVIALLYAVKP